MSDFTKRAISFPADLWGRLSDVAGDRTLNVCVVRALEEWVAAEEAALAEGRARRPAEGARVIRRGRKPKAAEPVPEPEPEPARPRRSASKRAEPTAAEARRARPTTSQRWGR